MDDIEPVRQFGEIAITFTGLAGLVSVLGSSTLHPDVRAWRVRNMILLSMMAFFVSLLPELFMLSGLPDALAWRFASLVLVLMQLGQFLFAGLVQSEHVDIFKPLGLMIFYAIGSVASVMLQGYNLSAAAGAAAVAPFLFGLYWMMALATLHFIVLVLTSKTT